jgi:hypothetical protein
MLLKSNKLPLWVAGNFWQSGFLWRRVNMFFGIIHRHHLVLSLNQGCTNAGHQVTMATILYTRASNNCVSSVWNLLHVTLLSPNILRWLQDLWKICVSLPWTNATWCDLASSYALYFILLHVISTYKFFYTCKPNSPLFWLLEMICFGPLKNFWM